MHLGLGSGQMQGIVLLGGPSIKELNLRILLLKMMMLRGWLSTYFIQQIAFGTLVSRLAASRNHTL